jgi:hypothetical protein
MRDFERHRHLTQGYLTAKRQIEALLYDVDPLGFGSSVGSPPDEYSDEAARLIPVLLAILAGQPRRRLDDVLPPPVDDALIEQLLNLARPLVSEQPDAE